MTGEEFAALERRFEAAKEAVAAARLAERAAYADLEAARCWQEFGPGPRGGMWRCTLQAGHDGDHSNIFSRGEG